MASAQRCGLSQTAATRNHCQPGHDDRNTQTCSQRFGRRWPENGSLVMKTLLALLPVTLLVGCAGGPTKNYYNPAVVGAKYKGPVTLTLVEDPKSEAEKCVREGYIVIGTSAYSGKLAESKEMIAQARRVGANHVVYRAHFVPAPPGSWSFSFGRGFGSGEGGGGATDMHIVFLGK